MGIFMNYNKENDVPIGIGKTSADNAAANPESKKQENPNRIPQTITTSNTKND